MILEQTTLIFLIVSIIAYLVLLKMSEQGKVASIRRLAAIDAIEEAIGRATEMGRPVHFTTGGWGNLSNDAAPQQLAGLTALSYVAKMTAELGSKLIVSICAPDVFIVAESITREVYAASSNPENFQSDTVRFLSGSQFGYASAVMGIFQRERPAANIIIGGFAAESLIFAETASKVGAFQIAGTANPSQIPFFVVAADYSLIGEEIYALDGYLSKDPAIVNSLAAEDVLKGVTLAMIVIGVLLITAGNTSFLNWLKL